MKAADKRHELQKNELAEWLGHQIEEIKPHLVPIVGVSLVAVAIIVALTIYFGSGGGASPEAWSNYFATFGERDTDAELKKVIEAQTNNAAGHWAMQSLGDMQLAQATALLFTPSRDQAADKLAEAEKLFKEVITSTRDPLLLTRARFSLAKTLESQLKPEEARKVYEQIAQEDAKSALGQAAAAAAKRLSNPREVELLAWFAKQKPKPLPQMPLNPAGGPMSQLPARPDLALPDDLGLGGIGETKVGESPSTPAPIGGTPLIEQKPEERKPAEPTADKPAEPKAETPKPEQPKTDEPKADAPKDDAKPAEAAKPAEDAKPAEPAKPAAEAKPDEAPKNDQPKAEESKTEAPKTEAPKADEAKPATTDGEKSE